MEKSESLKALAPALLLAQTKIKSAVKDKKNPHFGNAYADLSSVMDACKEALNGEGIAVIQTPEPSDNGKLVLQTVLMHKSGEWVGGTITMPLPKQDPQGYGSAMTYARRYGLASMVGVCGEDDDANAASGKSGTRPVSTSQAQAKKKHPSDTVNHLAEYGDIIDDEIFRDAYGAELRKRGFDDPGEARVLVAMCKKDKVKSINDLPIERRHAFVAGIKSGQLDKFKQRATVGAGK